MKSAPIGRALLGREMFLASSICSCFVLISASAKEPVDYVNPLLGAGSTKPTPAQVQQLGLDPDFEGFHGKVFPGACTPGGMVQLSPDTITGGDNGAGYSYPHSTIQGFSLQHLSGVGAYGDLGNFLVMPTTGPLRTGCGVTDQPGSGYLSAYAKTSEEAAAGYYAVTLDDYHVRAEMTAAPHSGILRFTFSKNPLARIQIDLARRVGGTSLRQTAKVTNDHTIEGEIECSTKGGGFMHGKVGYTLYYHAEFSRPLQQYGAWTAALPATPFNANQISPDFIAACADAKQVPGCRELEGQHIGFYSEFAAAEHEVVLLKVGISYASLEGARANLAQEIPDWNFDRLRQQARETWSNALGRMTVEGGTEQQKTIFYTALYHSLIDPRTATDVTGDYMGGDARVHHAVGFTRRTIFSGWDVYRSQFPLLTLIAPEVVNDQIRSAIGLAEENSTLTFERWELLNCYTGCMCGSPEVAVINDAYQKGIRNFDEKKAYAYAVNTCERFGNGELGYSTASHGLAITLQNAYCDWNLSRLADTLGSVADAKKFAARGQAYRNVFDPDAPWTYDRAGKDARPEWKGSVRGREVGGNWAPWEGLTSGRMGMESTVGQENWSIAHDVPGMIALFGGRETFVAKLNEFFERAPKLNRSNPYENHTNEPCHLVPFLFNRAGAPWLTQKWVRRLVSETYSASLNGLSGDDDEGQMSAWFVLASSGLHQACPGDVRFEIFSPLFDRVVIRLDPRYARGREFVVVAKNNSPQNVFIQSATLNGKPLERCWLDFAEIASGGTLELQLGSTPNEGWGRL